MLVEPESLSSSLSLQAREDLAKEGGDTIPERSCIRTLEKQTSNYGSRHIARLDTSTDSKMKLQLIEQVIAVGEIETI